MNFESLEKLWDQQTVSPLPAADALLLQLRRDVAAAERRVRGAMVIAVGLLVLEWLFAIGAHISGLKLLTALQLIGHVVASALYVALLLRARRTWQALQHERTTLGGTTRESIRATLRTIELQIGNVRVAAWAIPLVVGAIAWLAIAKYLAGDFPSYGVVAAIALALVLGTAIGAAIWHRYRRELSPRRDELRQRLEMLGQ